MGWRQGNPPPPPGVDGHTPVITFEFSHHKPVNEFTEFGEFLLNTDGEITTCSQDVMYYP